jgi:2-polyprenyl-3-methyl-5-hydroxy-6-metoxy-1,4-benzoquinol methylase/uncharacterized protein YbaR (Trm112 family)
VVAAGPRQPRNVTSIDPWYLQNLVCPVDRTSLTFDGTRLRSGGGRAYPVVDGVPVLLVEEREPTIRIDRLSIARAQGRAEVIDQRAPELYLETIGGIGWEERAELVRLWKNGSSPVDPVVTMIIGATAGNAYRPLIGDGSLREYPVPAIRLTPRKSGDTLLDVGCSWGRWSIAAARKGFAVVGIDASLGAVMAARRVARQLGLDIKYLVADARFLPFRDGRFNAVYSYSVLQHFATEDTRAALREAGRVLSPGGVAKIQMANKWGLRSLQHQVRRRFREPEAFEVRYWSVADLKSMFSRIIGTTRITADCYFGLGWQWSDFRYMARAHKPKLLISELLRRLSNVVPPMQMVADSVFCTAVKPGPSQ